MARRQSKAGGGAAATEAGRAVWGWAVGLWAAALLGRWVALDHIPGVNGDESWNFVLSRDFLAGRTAASPWITPTHRLNLLFEAPVMLLEALGWSGPWVMRLPAALFGTALQVGGVFLARALFVQRGVALGVGLAIACLPVHLAYARVSWDAALLSVVTLLPTFCILRGRWLGLVQSGLVALLAHPLAAFLSPPALFALASDAIPSARLSAGKKRALYLGSFAVAAAGLGLLQHFFLAASVASPIRWGELGWSSACQFVGALADVLSGGSTYVYFSGAPPPPAQRLLRLCGGLGVLALLVATWKVGRQRTLPMRRRLFPLGCVVGLLAFYGANPLPEPGTERYFLMFTVPILVSIGLWVDLIGVSQARLRVGACGLATAMLGSFGLLYFHAFLSTGGHGNIVYKTGPEDPKAAALRWILQDAAAPPRGTAPLHILADSWWTYWPLRYAVRDPSRVVIHYRPGDAGTMPPDGAVRRHADFARLCAEGAYAVGFSQGRLAALHAQAHYAKICARHDLFGYAAEPLLSVWRYCGAAPP